MNEYLYIIKAKAILDKQESGKKLTTQDRELFCEYFDRAVKAITGK